MLLVDGRKRVLWAYPRAGTKPELPFHFDDDTFFGPHYDRIISNQEEQQTIQVISFPGRKVLWHYGHVNVKGSRPGFLHTPDDAYLLANGVVVVADVGNCRLLYISRKGRPIGQIGTTGSCGHDPPRLLGSPNGDTPGPGGKILVSEITGSWIDAIGRRNQLLWSVKAPVRYPSDAQWLGHGKILLADYSSPGHILIMTRRGRVLWEYGPPSGPGALDHPSLALMLPNGLIAVNDDYRHRVVLISQKRHRIVWQYGHTDSAGRAHGFLDTPDGMDFLPFDVAMRTPALRSVVLKGTHRATGGSGSPSGGEAGVSVTPAGFHLPAPVQREVAVTTGHGILLAGGLAASGSSADGVFRMNPSTGNLASLGSVPQPFHDAAGAMIRSRLFVFGGGRTAGTDTVQAFDPATGRGHVVGHLPTALSDLAAAVVGGTVYLVGGFDGRSPQKTILATTDGVHFTAAAQLPVGLRYPAAAAVAGKMVIAGGVGPSGPTRSVYVFDPATRSVRRVGALPGPIGHATAVGLGGTVYVAGGQDGAGHPVRSLTAIDPTTGAVRALRPMPATFSDAAAVALQGGHTALIIGGLRGRALAQVLLLRANR